ncbi:YHS domain-containing (seleno)protein [Vibrio hannami]|uniref:YHS domain-containing (seleno)protein n=1 Tax=Vibrio hannami TaxID=2717094 RepID=UPI003EBF2F82
MLITLALSQLMFSLSAHAEDPVYTGIFSNKAVDGYDTVAYFTEGKPVKGSKEFKTEYMGADWYFASKENLDKFTADPEAFAPQYGGYCAWAIAEKSDFAPGDPEQWKIVDGKLYLNYNADIQNRWLKDVPGFIATGDKNWPKLIQQ